MDPQEIKEIIIKELPAILKDDPAMRELVLRMTEGRYADKEHTESRFDRILDQLERDREAATEQWKQSARERAEERKEQARLWEENSKRWDENNRRWNEQWDEQKRLSAEDSKRWKENREEQKRLWDENSERWDENSKRWNENREEQKRLWDENHQVIMGILGSIKALERRIDSTIGALGARWGLNSESSFRNALKGILEEHFAVQVVNVKDLDRDGDVFGRPDQIELDVIITNGLLIICEIKSSVSISDVHIFERKARFYERKHNRTATRIIVVSPMVDQRARALADQLGITVYSHPEDIEPSTFSR